MGAAPREAALEEDENLTMMTPLDEGPVVVPEDMSGTGVLRRPRAPPPQRVALVEGKDGPDATEGSESNFFRENRSEGCAPPVLGRRVSPPKKIGPGIGPS